MAGGMGQPESGEMEVLMPLKRVGQSDDFIEVRGTWTGASEVGNVG